MEIKVKKDVVKFEPIKVTVDFSITSYDELKEFIDYADDNGDVSQYNGNNSVVLGTLMSVICDYVAEGL